MNAWILATRPKTLPAGATPVVIGTALAAFDGAFALVPALIALVCALLMQIASNLINDLYDFRKGADPAERLGPIRVVAAGLLTEQAVKRSAIGICLVAFVLGQYLVWVGGWQILAIGILSLFIAWAYTGGPKPLAYMGLGEVCAFLFYGVVAVQGTYFVQTHQFSWIALVYSFVPGFWSANILLINNIRDISTDARVQKNTLAVKIGDRNARILYCICTALALVLPFQLAFLLFPEVQTPAWLFLPLLAVPLGVMSCRSLFHAHGAQLNDLQASTARNLIVHGFLLAIGLVLAR
ncbi:MAG: 1,4-dihydroxy-2-naphthoate polyprenyltransferase [Candidatus Kapaibacterium sp.]|nr:MAG: 1,4-dihydroxy-2-naphthoate polyprenyltransferase [Candidatus Kapabacteria bacterium]